jgi:hypothetical protein
MKECFTQVFKNDCSEIRQVIILYTFLAVWNVSATPSLIICRPFMIYDKNSVNISYI